MGKLFDAQHEPLRRALYSVITSLVGVAVVVGYLTHDQAVAVTGLAGGILSVPAVEYARTKVTPVVQPAPVAAPAEYVPRHEVSP